MKIYKKGTYQSKIGENLKDFNVYIVKSPDFWDFYVAFDCDPFYGGVTFDFDNFPDSKSVNDAVKLAEEKLLNLKWVD